MKEIGRYDSSLQMFVEKPKDLNLGTLLMWRMRAEKGSAGRLPEGRPAGEVAMTMVVLNNLPIERIMDRVFKREVAIGKH